MRIGLAGVGHQGRRYLDIVKPSVVLRKQPYVFDAVRTEEGLPYRTTNQLETFLEECEAVIVATPVETHWAIVSVALDAGKRVLCEKPLCETLTQFRDIELHAKPGQLTVGYTHLWHPEFEALRAAAEKRKPACVSVRWGGFRSTAQDWAPHAVAMASALGATDVMRVEFGRVDVRSCEVTWVHGGGLEVIGSYGADSPSDPPPLTRMVNWWLSGQQDYRSELWRRVEPAVLGLCGSAHAREETNTQ